MFIYLLYFLLLLVASFQGVIIPIMAEKYESPYFFCIMSTAQFSLFLVFAYQLYKRKISNALIISDGLDESGYIFQNSYKIIDSETTLSCPECPELDNSHNLTKYWKIMVPSGIYMGLSSLFIMYASNPERTPIVLQLILNGLNIVPSYFLTKYYLKKNVEYNRIYCTLSIITLVLSVAISIIPIKEFNFDSVIWPVIFLLGQLFRSFGYIMQEKYFIATNDRSTMNKLYNISYCRFVQLIITMLLFWLDIVMGYDSTFDPLIDDFESVKTLDINFLMLEIFVLSTVVFCVVAGYLNSISTNYSSVILTLVTPVVGLFFSIFPQLNSGEQYPLYITISSLALSLASTFLWMKGEKH